MVSKSESVKLIFNKPIAFMMEQANVFHAQLTADLADFTAVVSTINAAYLTAFADAIAAAEGAEKPTVAQGELKDLTVEVNELMKQARNSLQELFVILGMAYPGQPGKLTSYGKQKYARASEVQSEMVIVLDMVNAQLPGDSAALIAAGYSQAKIDAFGTLFAALKGQNTTQETFKGEKKDVTANYHEKLNAVWTIMSQISEISKIVYMNDFVKRQNYLLYDPATTGLSFTVTVPPAPVAVYHHVLEQLSPDNVVKFRIVSGIGDAWACFSLTNGGDCTGSQQMIPDGAEAEFNYMQLSNGSGQYLKLRQDGNVEMRINVLIPGL